MKTITTLLASLLLSTWVGCSCGDDDGNSESPDAGAEADASPSGDASCYENPTTHNQIINACTDSESFEKNPDLPLLNDDGSLPDLDVCQ